MKRKPIIISIVIFIVISLLSIAISLEKFGVSNPLSVIYGLFQIKFTGVNYVEIQANPKVLIAKPYNAQTLLYQYM